MATRRKLVSFDWAMKRLLRSKANFDILEGFLSELLHQDIKILEILESETNKATKEDKYSRIDLKVKNSDGEIILIEVQYESELDFLQRLLYGVSKTIAEHFYQGDSYSKIVKVISIAIVYFDLGKGSDYIYRGSTSFIGIHNQEPLALSSLQQKVYKKDFPAELYPEMYIIKVKNFDDFAKNTLDEWIYFLKNEEIKDNFKARGLLKAKKELDIMKMDEKQRKQYQAYLEDLSYQASMVESTYGVGKLEGEQIGIKKGIKKGREEGKKEGREEGKALSIIELLQEGEISFEKAEQKIDNLRQQAPDETFWLEIYNSLNNHKP